MRRSRRSGQGRARWPRKSGQLSMPSSRRSCQSRHGTGTPEIGDARQQVRFRAAAQSLVMTQSVRDRLYGMHVARLPSGETCAMLTACLEEVALDLGWVRARLCANRPQFDGNADCSTDSVGQAGRAAPRRCGCRCRSSRSSYSRWARGSPHRHWHKARRRPGCRGFS